jgi:hypothetical protein
MSEVVLQVSYFSPEGFWQFMGSVASAISVILAAIIAGFFKIWDPPKIRFSRILRYIALAVIIFIASIITGYFVIEHYPENVPLDSNISIKITYPNQNDLIGAHQNVKGVYSGNLSTGSHAWLLSRHRGPGPYIWWAPQGEILNMISWEIPASIGGSANETGKKYEIAAVIVDEQWNEYFHYYGDFADDYRCYPGVPLSKNAQIIDSIEVTRE